MIKFEPKLSIDGVAIILAAIGAAIYMGRLDAMVLQLKQNDAAQQLQIIELSHSQGETTKQLAIIATMVNDSRRPQ